MKNLLVIIAIMLMSAQHVRAQYLQFVENKGQWDKAVKFRTDFKGGSVVLEPNGYKVVLHNKEDLQKIADFFGDHNISSETKTNAKAIKDIPEFKMHSHAYEIKFLGGDSNAVAEPDKALSIYNNYFIGSDSTKWASGCKVYNGVTYKNIYKNIDVRYYSNNGNLDYDIIIKPGADVSKIALRFDGLDKLLLNKYGNLTLKTSVGDIYQSIPASYQLVKNLKTKVKAAFQVDGNTVHFKLGNYDKNSTLIIDPTEIFSTFVGSISDDWGYTATYDNDGNFYAGGIVFGAGYVNRGVGGYDNTFHGGDNSEGTTGYDISLIKFDPTGRNALFATYLGGSGDEQPHSLVVDSRGSLIISGRTTSANFPVTAPTFGNGGSFDIFLAKLSSDGRTLQASRKFGGSGSDGVNISPKYIATGTISTRRNYGDDARSEVITDNLDNIYLASCTQSPDFQTTPNAFKKTLSGRQDGVFIKVSSDLTNIYTCTLLGGKGDDAAFVLSLSNATGNIYIGGGTSSTDFAYNASNAPQGILHSTFQGGEVDGFISEISSDGSTLLKTCYVGGAGSDMVYGLQTDKFGYPFIMGTTTASLPVFQSAFNSNGNQVNGKQFITKLNPELTQVIYSANFGKGSTMPDISPTAFLVDICGNVYVSGWGGKQNSDDGYNIGQSVVGMSITPNAILKQTDGSDFYFFVLEKNANSQLFGSYFGQVDPNAYPDHVDGGTSRFDRRGVIYQAVCANCFKRGANPFPATTGSWSPGNPAQNGAMCNEAAVKIAFEFSGVISSIRTSVNGVIRDSSGCIPLTVDFADTIALGKKYIWSFGDGSPDVTTTNPGTSHTYTEIGVYRASVVSIDSSSCNIADTSYINIKAKSNRALLSAHVTKLLPCESFNYQFNNTSTPPAGFPFNPGDFTWDFGDGTTLITNDTVVTHQYAASGIYNVKLFLSDTTYCNSPDSAVIQLRVASILKVQFETPASACAPYNAVFNNTSLGGEQFVWNFGDGSPVSTDAYPTHLYQTPGTYTIKLSATDNLTCNPNDSASQTITVHESPVAAFTFSPATPQENTPYVYTNNSTGAVRYKWEFGDGDTLLTTDVFTPVTHIYNTAGSYATCLIAFNQYGCSDSLCLQLTAIVTPLIDVPNAFSPNGDGNNDKIFVQGYGISNMNWNIFNRWGQLVFRSSAVSDGWDGTYKGALQPQDVYGYTLSIIYTDGTTARKTGDITLLR